MKIVNFIINAIANDFVAFLALFLSLSQIIYLMISNRKNINIIPLGLRRASANKKFSYMFNFIIENKSNLSISISQIAIKSDNKEYKCETHRKMLLERTKTSGREVVNREQYFSDKIPININRRESVSSVFCFLCNQEVLKSDLVDLLIYTNRGIVKKNISIKDLSEELF